jgi:fluoride exporter
MVNYKKGSKMDILIIGLAGSAGAISRYFIYLFQASYLSKDFPYATILINVSGCFLAGLVLASADESTDSSKHFLTLVSIGFIGSFTTFSTFGVETLQLLQANEFFKAGLNVFINIILGFAAIWAAKTIFSN